MPMFERAVRIQISATDFRRRYQLQRFAKVGILQVAEAPTNMYDYPIPLFSLVAGNGVGFDGGVEGGDVGGEGVLHVSRLFKIFPFR